MKIFYTKTHHKKLSLHENFQIYGIMKTTICVCSSYIHIHLVTPLYLDTVAAVEPLWLGQNLIASSECHWDVHLHVHVHVCTYNNKT